MVIEKLSLKNFRGLLDETIDFDKSLTVFAGMNGGGKSWWDMQPVETGKPKAADITPGESLKAMYNRHAANSMN